MINVELNSELNNSVVPVFELNFLVIKREKKRRRLKKKKENGLIQIFRSVMVSISFLKNHH